MKDQIEDFDWDAQIGIGRVGLFDRSKPKTANLCILKPFIMFTFSYNCTFFTCSHSTANNHKYAVVKELQNPKHLKQPCVSEI